MNHLHVLAFKGDAAVYISGKGTALKGIKEYFFHADNRLACKLWLNNSKFELYCLTIKFPFC